MSGLILEINGSHRDTLGAFSVLHFSDVNFDFVLSSLNPAIFFYF